MKLRTSSGCQHIASKARLVGLVLALGAVDDDTYANVDETIEDDAVRCILMAMMMMTMKMPSVTKSVTEMLALNVCQGTDFEHRTAAALGGQRLGAAHGGSP